MQKLRTLGLSLIILAFGFAAGYTFSRYGTPLAVSASKQVRLGEGRLTNPLLECEVAEGTIDAEKINFKSGLEDVIASLEKETSVSEIAVYFRDLNNGPTFGVKQDDPFVPASLLKVPIMMAYYRAADHNASILERKLLFTGTDTSAAHQTIVPAERLTRGNEYTIDGLIERMIMYSDNDALLLLFKELPLEDHTHLYNLLGVDSSVVTNSAASLSVKQYAAFFRILYNSSFLSQERSEQALGLLTRIDYTNGLRKGVPVNVTVAHKFGERQINTGERHLHDCGIIYYPKHPYLLCVMTRGSETPVLERAIADVSEFVYGKIDEQYSGK
ncbi:serine hydrolase [Candidatus Kaiserbacteria bacterium]|nr:serine hydrolase [Candidatus Kaiserbacteria bacterium]